MEEILHQLGGLVLGSVPTMILFVLLVIAYGILVRRPLDKTLAERRARTSGAVEEARRAIGAAEAETTVYEDKLRNAKAEIFRAREQKLKEWGAERERSIEQIREAAANRIREARREVEQSTATAKSQIESMSSELSSRILAAVLPAGVQKTEAAQ